MRIISYKQSAGPLMAIFSATEFWAAIVGGLFTLTGTIISLWIQQRLQRIEQTNVAVSLFTEQVRRFSLLVSHIESHFNMRGEIWHQYVDNVEKSYNSVQRGVEYLIFVEGDKRTDLRNYFSNVYYMCQTAKFWQDQFYSKARELSLVPVESHLERSSVESALVSARQQMKDCVLELKRLNLSAPHLTGSNRSARA